MTYTKVYGAEDSVFLKRYRQNRDNGMALEDARALIHRYVPGIAVRRGRKYSGGCYQPAWRHRQEAIILGTCATLPLVLHEIAHALTHKYLRDHGRKDWHGQEFRETYVKLVRDEMSPWWARRLAAAFRRAGYTNDEYEVDHAA